MKFKALLIGLAVAGSAALSCNAMADAHTWHTVRTLRGVWAAKLQMLNENGSFITRDNQKLTNFTITPDQEQDYGFQFEAGDDFDVAYTLTLVQTSDSQLPQFSSKSCIYIVTAKGPAQPDIRVENFNGAKCTWNVVPGVGEDFLVE